MEVSLINVHQESLTGQIARHALANPHGLAVKGAGGHVTYQELDNESNRLAIRLSQAGSEPSRCVALLLDRSPQFVVAALAVMKSGAAYLPLDLGTPPNRVASILSDAEAVALLTTSQTAAWLPSGAWHVIDADDHSATEPLALADSPYSPEDLAYIVYTSGSTGEAKGVEISHASLNNLIHWHQSAFHVTSSDRASQVASFGFDAAVWEIWPYLAAGATVHIADELTRRSWESLRDWMVSERITIGFVPTALAEQMILAGWPSETRLRVLLTGGDVLRRRPIAGLPFVVVNNYGPTECTVVATSGIISANGNATPSIGTPIANATALILDEALQPVPHGSVGELCIGGRLVGRGYRNRPGLTSTQFINYVSHERGPLRVYRTGDRARWLPNGEIAFLGRIDDQVKIRGQRIELGEIVARLNQIGGVEGATVVAREVADLGRALVAYLVLAPDTLLSAERAREFLGTQLPDYMIPAFFVRMPEFPRMLNGKVDVSSLPTPNADNLLPEQIAESVNSGSDGSVIRQRITKMVASMLGRDSVRPEDNFFMLGGHSMLGMELVGRISETFGVKLTLRQLFTAPTVAGLSAEVARMTKVDP